MKVIITGGTIDKQYNHLNGELVLKDSSIIEMLIQSRISVETDIETLMLKDSLEMNDQDRRLVSQACNNSKDKQIIITHGTDTMVETAHTIAADLAQDKIVVLLGAMVPHHFKGSDALFNLGCAITAVQLLPSGVYITMNGRVFNYRDVKKNRELGYFEKHCD